ncbi:mitochondrial inner membrane protein OXA1-like isoform X2 [Arachis stenosperma]|nr:mitochondrial inner membrane protein OXA1-like isoform X2 [Arachis stenosperma]
MAYRRYLLRRTNLSNCNFHPSFSYVLHHTIDEPNQRQQEKPVPAAITSLIQARSFGSFLNGSTGFGASSKRRTIFNNTFSGYSLCRYISTLNDDSDKINFGVDVVDVLAETTIDTVASQATGSVVDEVAIAAADSLLPAKMVQYAIDYVHSFTGMNWWAAIVMTTFLVRMATIPFLVNQLKANSRFTVLRLKVDEIKAQMEDKASDPSAVAEGQKQIEKLFKEYGVSPFPSLQGVFIQAPILISFFVAILNMAEKMPSLKHGGAYWFTDLTTPDSLYIFPVLTALSFLVIVEHNIQEGSDGTLVESSTTMRNLSRAASVLVVPFAMELPKAIFCFWLTSNLFSIIYGLVIRVPSVKKSLGIPVIVVDSAPADAPESQR